MGTTAIAGSIKNTQDKDGMLKRALEKIIQLYTDKSHFVFELLQNAEDAEAKVIRFVQHRDYLEVMHDGKPFTTANLDSLCDIGKSDKAGNLNQIGEFGVGFKSVFGICDTVKLYSVPRQFRDQSRCEDAVSFAVEITDFINPKDIEETTIDSRFTTKFVFPYAVGRHFSGYDSFDELNRAVAGKLQNLGITTLLFMKNLETIEYEIDLGGSPVKGEYLLEKEVINDHCIMASAIGISSQKNKDEEISYLRFTRPVDNVSTRTVDIAFPVRKLNDGTYECQKPKSPYVSVYFPTETESKLNFIVQGPYRTTPNRSSIPADDKDNRHLAGETAALLRDSLLELRELGKLNMSFIKALPLSEKSFESFNLFYPLYEIVKALFLSQVIIPSLNGGYTSAKFAKIARQERLATLMPDDLLSSLVNDGNQYHWLPTFLTETNREYEQVYRFLTGELNIGIIRPEDLRILFSRNPEFLSQMTDDWLISLYTLLENIPTAFSRKSNEPNMLTANIIKTSTGEFVSACRRTEDKQFITNVFIPTDKIHSSDINFVDMSIYNQCRHFFDNVLQIHKPNEYAVIINDIKKRYRESGTIDEEQHIGDIKALLKYVKYDDYKSEVESVIKKYIVLMCKDEEVRSPYENWIYLPVSTDGVNIEGYFKNVKNSVFFVDAEFYMQYDISIENLLVFGVKNSILTGDTIKDGIYETGKRGNQPTWWTPGEFCWKLSLDGINDVLKYISDKPNEKDSILKSQAIFKVLMNNETKLRGQVKIGGSTPNLEEETCDLIKTLRGEKTRGWNGKWLFTHSMELVSQKEVSKHDISTAVYGKIKVDSDIYEMLGFRKTESDQVDDLKKQIPQEQLDAFFESELRQRFGISSSELTARFGEKSQSTSIEEEDSYSFPVVRVKNWESLKKHAAEMLTYADPVKYESVIRRIRVSDHPKEAKAYLHGMYRYDGSFKYACQLCQDSCSSIERVQLFEENKVELDPMNLCMCPNCAAKYRNLRPNNVIMSSFKQRIIELNIHSIDDSLPIKIKWYGNDEIWFTQTHLAEIQELIKLSDEVDASDKEELPKQIAGLTTVIRQKTSGPTVVSIAHRSAPDLTKHTNANQTASVKTVAKPAVVLIKKGTGQQRIVSDTKPVINTTIQNKKRHLLVGDTVEVKDRGVCIVSKLSPGWVRVKAKDKKESWYPYPSSYDKGDIKLLDNN